MKPYIICHMMSSIDGRQSLKHWTKSPDGMSSDWSENYATIHEQLAGDAWIVGRTTMAGMTKAGPSSSPSKECPDRPCHLAVGHKKPYAVALDPQGRLHFDRPHVGGDHVVVLLGANVSNNHLVELALDGVSYIVSETPDIDLAAMLETLNREFDIKRLLLEGGGGTNGSFFAAGLVDELSVLIALA